LALGQGKPASPVLAGFFMQSKGDLQGKIPFIGDYQMVNLAVAPLRASNWNPRAVERE
jgi:predicted methyltransferase